MKRIILTAGHGNGDPGALAATGEREADLALALRDAVARAARARGIEVIEDGADDANLPLRDALKLLRANPGVEAWEFHFNAGPPKAQGVEILAPVALKARAQLLARVIATQLNTPLRGDGGWKPSNGGQHQRLAFCDAGGGIIEVEFISNAAALEQYLLRRDVLAECLAVALA